MLEEKSAMPITEAMQDDDDNDDDNLYIKS